MCDAMSAWCVCIQFDKYLVVLSRFESPSGPLKPVHLLTYQTRLTQKVDSVDTVKIEASRNPGKSS